MSNTQQKPFPWKNLSKTSSDGLTKKYADFIYRHSSHEGFERITIKVDNQLAVQRHKENGKWSEPYITGWLPKKADIFTDWDGVDQTE